MSAKYPFSMWPFGVVRNMDLGYFQVTHFRGRGDAGGHDVQRELCDWINGGDRPAWMDSLKQRSDIMFTALGAYGITVRRRIISSDEGRTALQDESDEAKAAQALLVDILTGKLPVTKLEE